MKKILYSLLAGSMALMATSCMSVDNFDEPAAVYTGKIIDSTTGEPVLASQGECKIRLWEMSYSLNPGEQNIPLKQDGSFRNVKLFNGTYDVQPLGAWWPVEKHRVPIGPNTAEDIIEVTPFLHVIDFEMEYDEEANELLVSCRLSAPITDGIPNLRSVRPFLSLVQFCGANSCIGEYHNNPDYKFDTNMAWSKVPKAEDGNSVPYEFRLPVKKGYFYFVRMGARVTTSLEVGDVYNYSEIKTIDIPQ